MDSGWGARAHLTLPDLSDALPRQGSHSSDDQDTRVYVAPTAATRASNPPLTETIGLIPDDALLSGELDEPSGREEAIEYITQTLERPPDERVPTDVKGVPRGRGAKPLRPHSPPAQREDDGSGWVFGTLILAVIGFLIFTYMPEDTPLTPATEIPEARPSDIPGQAWNPEVQDRRGFDESDAGGDAPPPPNAPPAASQRPRAPSSSTVSATSPPATTEPTGSGTVRVTGFADRVTLIGGGRRLPPGEVPSGSYRIEAVFQDGQTVKAGRIQVTEGSAQTLHCSKVYKTCRVE